jgi:cytochrome c oxidase cbb3-type subunit II
MNYGPLIFFGVFLTLASSWCGLVLIPQIQFGRQQAVKIEETGETYPLPRPGLAQQGLEVYRANGCVYCHSQQVRASGYGADLARNWGQRRTVARDYLYD